MRLLVAGLLLILATHGEVCRELPVDRYLVIPGVFELCPQQDCSCCSTEFTHCSVKIQNIAMADGRYCNICYGSNWMSQQEHFKVKDCHTSPENTGKPGDCNQQNRPVSMQIIIGSSVGGLLLCLASVIGIVMCIKCKRNRLGAKQSRVDVNPVYGDYADPDYVCEMEDMNTNYASSNIYEEGRAQAMDFNSTYGG
jgi:hypothetical protein